MPWRKNTRPAAAPKAAAPRKGGGKSKTSASAGAKGRSKRR